MTKSTFFLSFDQLNRSALYGPVPDLKYDRGCPPGCGSQSRDDGLQAALTWYQWWECKSRV